VKLTLRLAAIADLIVPGSRLVDVGTDHALLPVWLLAEGVCPFVIATDVAPGPLEAARRSAGREGVSTGIDFRLADGLDAVMAHEVDTVVIAGMGGETMQGIIARAPWLKSGPVRMILQPQSKVPELLEFLSEEGYSVTARHEVADAGKGYVIFAVEPWELT